MFGLKRSQLLLRVVLLAVAICTVPEVLCWVVDPVFAARSAIAAGRGDPWGNDLVGDSMQLPDGTWVFMTRSAGPNGVWDGIAELYGGPKRGSPTSSPPSLPIPPTARLTCIGQASASASGICRAPWQTWSELRWSSVRLSIYPTTSRDCEPRSPREDQAVSDQVIRPMSLSSCPTRESNRAPRLLASSPRGSRTAAELTRISLRQAASDPVQGRAGRTVSRRSWRHQPPDGPTRRRADRSRPRPTRRGGCGVGGRGRSGRRRRSPCRRRRPGARREPRRSVGPRRRGRWRTRGTGC